MVLSSLVNVHVVVLVASNETCYHDRTYKPAAGQEGSTRFVSIVRPLKILADRVLFFFIGIALDKRLHYDEICY